MKFIVATAEAVDLQTIAIPLELQPWDIMSLLGNFLHNVFIFVRIDEFNDGLRVINTESAVLSCSNCEITSIAVDQGLLLRSAIIIDSEGPAMQSVPVVLAANLFAAVTKTFPGPTILSTFLTACVPIDIAAIA